MLRSRSATSEREWYEPFVGAQSDAAAAAAADDYVPFGPGAGTAKAGAGQQHAESQPTATQPLLSGGGRGAATNGPAVLVDPNGAALASFDLWEEGA